MPMGSSVDAQYVVTTECMTVTSAMRKSSRWVNAGIAAILGAPSESTFENAFLEQGISVPENSLSTGKDADVESVDGAVVKGDDKKPSELSTPETVLILGFPAVRSEVAAHQDGSFSTLAIAKPFLEVIKSPLVAGHITSLALTSIEKFFVLNIFRDDSKDIKACLDETIHALTHCRFESTDRQEDDAVLLQLMALIDKIVSGHSGQLLSPKAVGEVVETCMSMAKQMKQRDSLRRSVVATLLSLVRQVFGNNKESLKKAAESTLKTLVKILDPTNLQHTNSIRVTVLSILKASFEVSGKSIGDSESKNETMQTLWKYLAQLIRVTNNARLVQEALQLAITIFNTAPAKYKAQFEFILVYVLTSLTPLSDLPRDESADDMFYAGVPNRAKCVKSAPVEPGSHILAIPTAAVQKTPEIREVMVEALATLAVSNPTIFSDLFINYDCDRASPDLCEDLIGFLCRNAYPDSATWSTASVPPLCLEAVLSGINVWAENISDEPLSEVFSQRLEAKGGKAIEAQVAEKFNKSPSKGVEDMIKLGLVKSSDPYDIAQFLHTCGRLNKAVLGKYFAKSENKEVLEQYVKSFDFAGLRIDEALRILLCSFRLPGESAQIENLLQKFADHYIAAGEKVEKSSDSAFILAYAVLMLNTDHYSPTLKRRMDYEAFRRNVQGVDKEIPDEYVHAIFDGITTQEIIMPEEHDTDETFEHSWRELVLSKQPTEEFTTKHRSKPIVKAVFETSWRPIVSTLSFVFATATDDLVFRRVISGFHQLAILATRFQSQQALTHIIACLSQISALSSGDLAFPNSNVEVRIEDHISVIVSDLSTQFGGDLKAQMASITLFRILNVAAAEVGRNACSLVAKALTNIYLYGLGTPSSVIEIKPLPPVHKFERSKAGKPVGILSALSSYLTSSPDTPAEPSDENVDAALGATECIKACKIDETILRLIKESPKIFADGVLDVVPTCIVGSKSTISDEAQSAADENPRDRQQKTKNEQRYEPAKDFLLRLAGKAAADLPEYQKTISGKAIEFGLTATALLVAPKSHVNELLDKLNTVEPDILEILLKLPSSPSVWRLLGLLEHPDKSVVDYIRKNADQLDDRSVVYAVECLRKVDVNKDKTDSLEALSQLANQFRNKPHYIQILAAIGSLISQRDATIRENAVSELQRELLHEKQALTWAEVANNVLIPEVLEVLLKPEVWKTDPSGMDITRQQTASMTGKGFLHLTVSLNSGESSKDVDAWIAVLKILDRLLSSRRQPVLQETVIEMLKNVLLVTKLASRGSTEFWERTQAELKGFLPQVAELAVKDSPAEAEKQKKPTEESRENQETTEVAEASSAESEGDKVSEADATTTETS